MKFLSPGWLWMLLALMPIYFFAVIDERRRQRQFARFAAQPVWRALAPEMDPGARLRKFTIWLGVVAFTVLALARPQWGSHEETVKTTGLDIMVVLDVSNSMETEDVIPSRLKKSRHFIKNFVEQLKGDRVGMVAFAASSYVACPLTTDTDYLIEMLQIMGPKMVTNQGTDIGLGLDTARKALDRGAEEISTSGSGKPEDAAGHPQASHVVVLISDGEDQETGAIEVAKALKDNGTKLYVLGVGTEKGGPISLRDDQGNLLGYKKDHRGQPVVSTFHPDALMQVAAAGGGRYWNLTSDEGEVEEMLQDMGALNRTDYAERKYLVYEDRFQFPLAIAVLLALIEISMPVRRIRKRPVPGSVATGIVALLLLTGGQGLLGAREAQAAGGILKDTPPLDAYLENEKGLKAFKDGKVEEAQKKFGTAQALDPDLPELQYNQGIVQLQGGDAESAIRDFDSAAKGARERGNEALAGKSLYNLGGALAKKGDTQAAVQSYLGAIDSAQKSKDAGLEEDARKNLQLLIKERQKQKQQQKEDEKKKGDPKDQKDDQKDKKDGPKDPNKQGEGAPDKDKDKDKKDKEDKDGKKDKPKQYQDPKKSRENFKSPKMTKDDAERVMSELSNKERELQAKVKKQSGTPQNQGNAKDW